MPPPLPARRAGDQSLPLRALPGPRLLRLAARRSARPPAAARREDDRGPEVRRAASRRSPPSSTCSRNETLHHDASDRFELDAYFGRDPAELHQALAQQLFANVKAPLLRTRFHRADGRWRLEKIAAIGVADVPAQHRAFLLEAAKAYVSEKRAVARAAHGQRAAEGRDPVGRERSAQAVERGGGAPVHRDGACGRPDRRGDRARRARAPARVRRPPHPRRDRRRRLHVRVRAPRRVARHARRRRPRLDPQVHEQGLPARADEPPPDRRAEDDGRAPREPRPGDPDARPAVRAEASGQRLRPRRAEDRGRGPAREPGQQVLRDLGAADRAGVAADRIRLARRRLRPPPALRLQVLHGARPLEGEPGRRASS